MISMASVVLMSGCATSPSAPVAQASEFEQLLERANNAYTEARFDDAERLLIDITNRYPTIATAWFRLGNVYYRTGRYPAAVRAYEQTLLYEQDHANAWHNLALTRIRQAEEVVETGLAMTPLEQPERQALAALRATLLLKAGER
jgi:tetratricopeptide (TPR) repeat protein